MHPVKTITERLFVPVVEAAEILQVDPRTLRRAIAAGQVPSTRVGTRTLIPSAWLRAQAGQSA